MTPYVSFSLNILITAVHKERTMSSGALFPSLSSGSRSSSSKYLVEFRAGKMSLKASTVTPDKRKGMVYVQQTDDSLIHFCWKDRTSGNVEDVSVITFSCAPAIDIGIPVPIWKSEKSKLLMLCL